MSLVSLGRPGRIDLRTRGGVGDGSTDNSALFTSLVAEASANGAELYVPDGTYRGAMSAANNLRLTGPGTIKAKSGATAAPLTIPYAVTDVTVEGIGLDGAGLLGCLHIGVSGSSAVANERIQIRGVRFANTKDATATQDSQRYAIYSEQGFHHGSIAGCFFADTVGGAIKLTKPHHATIIGNHCAGTIVSNFIAMSGSSGSSYAWGDGIVISGNVAVNVYRIGIEIQSADHTDQFGPVVIAQNSLGIANSGQSGSVFAISIPNAPGSVVSANVCETDLLVGSGIEASSRDMAVIGNWVRGWDSGITNTGSAGYRVRFEGNTVLESGSGFVVANSATDAHDQTIVRNRMIDCRDIGFDFGNGGAWGGSVIEGNEVWRGNAAAWASTDASRTFHGITGSAPDRKAWFKRNRIVQYSAVPTLAGMNFWRTNGTGSWSRTEWIENQAVSRSTSPFGTGLYVTNAANVQDGRMIDNLFKNLVTVVATADLRATRFEQGGNRNEGCTNPETNLARAFYGLALPPSTHSTTPVMPSYLGATDNPNPASPPTGYHRIGDWYTNATPDSGEHWGIICTVAGSPGTFKSMGTIAA